LIGNPYYFAGRRLDQETGLYYFRYRYYDSEIGRFINPEPESVITQLNYYSYVDNNPVNFADPTGLWSGWEVYHAWELANWGQSGDWITPPYLPIPFPYEPAIRYRVIPISETTFEMQYQKGHKFSVLPVFPFPIRWIPLYQSEIQTQGG
jgi:RHS repeat-associated protein